MKKLCILSLLLLVTASFAQPLPPTNLHPTGPNPCGMVLNTSPVIFCYQFDSPGNNGTRNGIRSGDLDKDVWGVSRGIGEAFNPGQGFYNQWNQTAFIACDGTTPNVIAQNDVQICNGQLREAVNDNNTLTTDLGDVTVLAMYPKQPFDFTGRTGTISFDVSNDTSGIHGSWPELWISDLPVPMPFNHFDSWQALPENSVGVRLDGFAIANNIGTCPTNANITQNRWTMESNSVSREWILDDTFTCNNGQTTGCGFRPTGGSNMSLTVKDCVIMAGPDPTGFGVRTGPTQMNHVEVQFSQNTIEVWGWDAGVKPTNANKHHLGTFNNVNLGLTSGLVWLEDVHYNADKSGQAVPTQRQHAFSWDNLAFDGPFTHRDFTFDAPDNNAPGPNGSLQLGQHAAANAFTTWTIAGLPANRQAAAAVILFNFAYNQFGARPTVIKCIVNGNPVHTVPWPFPDTGTSQQGNTIGAWRTFHMIVPLTEIVTGTNTVQLGTDAEIVFTNVDIALANVTGGVPVLPGSNNKYPGT